MRALAFLLVIALVLFVVWTILKVFEQRAVRREAKNAEWEIDPRTNYDTMEKELWLVCRGHKDYLFKTLPMSSDQTEFDKAYMDAVVQCRDFNDQRHLIGSKYL